MIMYYNGEPTKYIKNNQKYFLAHFDDANNLYYVYNLNYEYIGMFNIDYFCTENEYFEICRLNKLNSILV